MAAELGVAYVSIIPEARGLGKRVAKEFGVVGKAAESTGRSAGSKLMGAVGTAAKRAATGALVGAGVAAGAALMGGFASAVNQQTAQKVLSGLYGSASQATKMMEDLRKVSSSSPIEYTAYTKAAEALAYAGVEGNSAVSVLENVGHAITATGGTSEHMDRATEAVTKMVNAGKVSLDSLQQLSGSGVPIISGLADHFGVSMEEINKMASEGAIGLEDVVSVMENATGDNFQMSLEGSAAAALSFGNQFKIAKDNIVTAIGSQLVPLLEKLAPVVGRVGDAVSAWISGLDFTSWKGFVSSLTGGDTSGALKAIGDSVVRLAPAMKDFAMGVADAAPAIGELAAGGLNILAGALSWLSDHIGTIVKFLPVLIAGFVGWRMAVAAQTTLFAVQAPILAYSNTLRATAAILEFRAARATAANSLATSANTTATGANNAATNAGVLARTRARIATVTATIAQRAATIATWAGAAAQRAFGAALRFAMGPIGLIITGIALLVAGLVWFFTQTEIGQAIIQVVWTAIKAAISAVVTWFTTVAWPAIQAALTFMGNMFSWLYTNIILPVWNGIKTAIAAAWAFISPIFNFIVNFIKNFLIIYFQLLWTVVQLVWKGIQIAIKVAWAIIKVIFNAIVSFVRNVLGPIFEWFWNSIIKPVWNFIKNYISNAWAGIKIIFNAIKSFLQNTLGPVFEWLYNNVIKPVWNNIKSSINTVWKFVRDKVFDPMKKAVSETVPNAFEAGKDAIAKAWDKIKDVAKKPVKFVIDTVINKGIIDNFNKIAGIFDVDKIDHVTLPKGFATGGYTGAGRKYKPAGIVHADEYVIRKESQQKISRTHGRGALDYMNRTGRIPGMGYAKGGKVGGGTLIDAANWWVNQGARGSRHPAFGGAVRSGHSRGSLHYQDRAVDLNYGPGGQNATEMAFFDRLIGQFKSLFPGIRTIWRAPGHYNHLHIDTSNGADIGDFSGSSSGGGLLNILNPFQGLFDKIKSGITSDGMFGDLVAGGAKKMVQAPIDWIKSNASMIGDVFEGVQDAVGTGTTKARVRAVATARGWGFGQQWRDLSALIQQESSWDKNAANPSSSARGLFQKMTSLHGPLEKTVEGQAGWGLNYIKRTYGTPSAAWAFHKRNNWYAGGGHVAPTLYDKGGMLQPGTSLVANKTKKPEYILPAKVTDALMSGSATSGERKLAEQIILQGSPEETLRALDRRERKRDLLYAR